MSGSPPEPFSVTVDRQHGGLVVAVRGELDLATAPQLEDALLPTLREGGRAMLDLRALEFMDSTGVRVIVAAHLAAEEHGGRLALVRTGTESPVGRVLEISGLNGILHVVDDV
ncbi:MAG: hypothetical protein JWR63_1053 [Conexibacter sp.]|nr:hypothetical protein [Conexibacter sp.]